MYWLFRSLANCIHSNANLLSHTDNNVNGIVVPGTSQADVLLVTFPFKKSVPG